MKRIGIVLFGLAMAAGCHKGGTMDRAANTTVKGMETAGTATWDSAKTVGGTARGTVTGGIPGAKEEYRAGARETKTDTNQKAAETRDAYHGVDTSQPVTNPNP